MDNRNEERAETQRYDTGSYLLCEQYGERRVLKVIAFSHTASPLAQYTFRDMVSEDDMLITYGSEFFIDSHCELVTTKQIDYEREKAGSERTGY